MPRIDGILSLDHTTLDNGVDNIVYGDENELIVDECTLEVRATFHDASSKKIALRFEVAKFGSAGVGFSEILGTRQGVSAPGNFAEHVFDPADGLDQRDRIHTTAIRRSGRNRAGAYCVGGDPVDGDTIAVDLTWDRGLIP